MNLDKLFQMQKALDERINKEHGLEGQDLLPKKILALQVELGELANEWRGFKFWSMDQEPRTKRSTDSIVDMIKGDEKFYNPLLEEYVDCLHFILSIGNDFNLNFKRLNITKEGNITDYFLEIIQTVINFDIMVTEFSYNKAFTLFIELGEHLGFTWEQIEQAYLEKNKVNHSRQTEGY